MKKLLKMSFVVLLALALTLSGCTGSNADNTTNPDTTTIPRTTGQAAPDSTTAAGEQVGYSGEGEITFFSMNLNLTVDDYYYLMAYPNPDGTVYVELVGEVKKIGTNMDAAVLQTIGTALDQTTLWGMNGQNVYEEGAAGASVYVEYSDGVTLGAGFGGVVPLAFLDGYEAMETCFETITAQLEVYVPVPFIGQEVDEAALAELMQILENSGIEALDSFQITNVPLGDVFAYTMGLSSDEGIVNGTNCSPMMMTTPYSLVIATVADVSDADDVQADFLENLDWTKWVCVMPTDAMTAQKGNMVLCLMGADTLYSQTADAILENGWVNVQELEFPGA